MLILKVKARRVVTSILSAILAVNYFWQPKCFLSRPQSSIDKDTSDITLPPWMIDYFQWHAKKVQKLSQTNWRQHRYLVMHCIDSDFACGGASDRLHSIPLMLRYAHIQNRIIYIKWTNPAPLEKFLLPRTGFLDWRLPDWLERRLPLFRDVGMHDWHLLSNRTVVNKVGFSYKYGEAAYNSMTNYGDLSFDEIYSACWDSLFCPTPPLLSLIPKTLSEVGLENREFTSLHLRVRYGFTANTTKAASVGRAVTSAVQQRPGRRVFVSGDSQEAVQQALNFGFEYGYDIVARKGMRDFHLDLSKADVVKDLDQAMYSVFVDLYILRRGECLTAGEGGFGLLANRLSKNITCITRYQ